MTQNRNAKEGSRRNVLLRGLVALTCVGIIAACNEQSPFSVANEAESGSSLASAGAAEHTDVFIIGDGAIVGKATLVRRATEVSLSVNSSGLVPGDAITFWVAMFQNPENCVDGCGGDDLNSPGVDGGVIRAAGKAVGGAGRAGFTGKLALGATATNGNVLTEIDGTEFHAILRTHGEAFKDKEALREQLSSTSTGCNPTCANVQAAVFLP